LGFAYPSLEENGESLKKTNGVESGQSLAEESLSSFLHSGRGKKRRGGKTTRRPVKALLAHASRRERAESLRGPFTPYLCFGPMGERKEKRAGRGIRHRAEKKGRRGEKPFREISNSSPTRKTSEIIQRSPGRRGERAGLGFGTHLVSENLTREEKAAREFAEMSSGLAARKGKRKEKGWRRTTIPPEAAVLLSPCREKRAEKKRGSRGRPPYSRSRTGLS